MPRKTNAKVLARMDCPSPGCGERVAVMQASNGYLYTRCPECLADQRRGAGVQAHIWQHMEPVEGATIIRPPNLPAECGEIGQPMAARTVPEEQEKTVVPEVQENASEKPGPGQNQGSVGTEPEVQGTGGLWALVAFVGIGVAAIAATAS